MARQSHRVGLPALVRSFAMKNKLIDGRAFASGILGQVSLGVAEIKKAGWSPKLVSIVIDTADWITPVPGGVGPVTVSILMQNTLVAAKRLMKPYEKQFSNPLIV